MFYNTVPYGVTAEGFPVLGFPDAPITLVEYSNFSCPGCAEYEAQTRLIIEQQVLTRRARYVYVPMTFGGREDPSHIAASAAMCATRQNNFWALRSALFNIHRTVGPRSFTPEVVRETANVLGLDGRAIYDCVVADEYAAIIDRANRLGRDAGIDSPPRLAYSLDGGKTQFLFVGIAGQRYAGAVPPEVVDQTVEISLRVLEASRGSAGSVSAGTPVAPTAAPGASSGEFTRWSSPDGIVSAEIPTGWRAGTASAMLGPVAYALIGPATDGVTGIVIAVVNVRELGITRLPANATSVDILRAALPNTREEDIRSVKVGSYQGAAVRQNLNQPDPRTGQGVQTDIEFTFVALGRGYVLIVASIAPTAEWDTLQPTFDRFKASIQLDVDGAISRIGQGGSTGPVATPTRAAGQATRTPIMPRTAVRTPTRAAITRTPATARTPVGTPVRAPTRTSRTPTPTASPSRVGSNPFAGVQFGQFQSPDTIVSFQAPRNWSITPLEQNGPIAYSVRAPNTSPASFSLIAAPISELAIRNLPQDPTPENLLKALYPNESADKIGPVELGNLSGATIQVTIQQAGTGQNRVTFVREVTIYSLSDQNVLLIDATTLSETWEFAAPIFERMRNSVNINVARANSAIAAYFASLATPTPTPRPVTATVPPPTSGGQYDLVQVGEGPCVGVKDPTDVKIPENAPKKFSAPEQVIDPTHRYCAILTTDKGRIVVQLYPKLAPKHVNSFVFLASQGFFDNTTWHRVVANFIAQAGDPTGTGTGGAGYTLPLEVKPEVRYDRPGVLGAARATAPNSASSQFFITLGPQPNLNAGGTTGPGYTIFGQVVEGIEVVQKLTPRNPTQSGAAPGDKLISVRIVDLGAAR